MTWKLETRRDTPMLALAQVIILQDAWRRLTPRSRAVLLGVAEDPDAVVHPTTAQALRAHGLLDEHGGLTEAGAAVVRHRPNQSGEQHG